MPDTQIYADTYRVQPLPYGVDATVLKTWAANAGWTIKPLKNQGPSRWLVAAQAGPPESWMTFNGQAILIQKMPPKMPRGSSTPRQPISRRWIRSGKTFEAHFGRPQIANKIRCRRHWLSSRCFFSIKEQREIGPVRMQQAVRTLHQGRDWILRIQTWRKTCSFWEIHLIRPSGLTSQSIKTYVGHLGRLCKPRVLGNERNHRCNLTVRSKTDARLQGVNAMTGDREEAFVPCFICRQVQAFDRSQRLVLLESKKFPQCKVPRKVRVFRVLLGRHGNEVHMNMHFVDGSAGLSYASPRYLDLRPSLVPGTIAFSATSTEATTPKEMQLGRTFRRNFLQHEGQAGTESKSTQGIRMSKHAVRCFVLLRGSARARA